MGIPKEGIAASNDAKGTIGPPSFKDAVFELNRAQSAITMRMVYF